MISSRFFRLSCTDSFVQNVTENKRFYFSAAVNRKPIMARLKEQEIKLSLETFEPHEHYRYLMSKYIVGLEPSQSTLELQSWAEKLSILADGMIGYNFISPVSSHYIQSLDSTYLHSLNSQTQRQFSYLRRRFECSYSYTEKNWKDIFGFDYDPMHHKKLYAKEPYRYVWVPDLLYSIPQNTWDDFLSKLSDQEVVRLLNLRIHRHLWPSYNYALCAVNDSIKKNRAIQFGEFHFLNSLLEYEKEHDDKLISNDLTVFKLFTQIDHGKQVLEILKNREPYLTRTLINKFSHYHSWDAIGYIGYNLLQPKATQANGNIHKQTLDSFIAALPSSKKEPNLFSNMINDYQYIDNLCEPIIKKDEQSRVFYQAKNNFGFFFAKIKYDQSLLNDYYQAITKDLIFPEVARQLVTMNVTFDMYNVNEIYQHLVRDVAVFFLDKVKLEKLVLLEQRWHRNVTFIGSKKPPSQFITKWYPLFQEQSLDDITFTCLTSESDLQEEGILMSHCISGYGSICSQGISHIIRALSKTGDRSTLELSIDKNSEEVKIRQNRSYKNAAPSEIIQHASDKLVSLINNKQISLNIQRGRIYDTTVQETEYPIKHIYPYYLNDLMIQAQIYQAYKETKTLPSFMNTNTYSMALEESGLNEFIYDHINNKIMGKKTNTLDIRPHR